MALPFVNKILLKPLRNSRQIKETDINQIDTMLYFLALSPLIAP